MNDESIAWRSKLPGPEAMHGYCDQFGGSDFHDPFPGPPMIGEGRDTAGNPVVRPLPFCARCGQSVDTIGRCLRGCESCPDIYDVGMF